MRKTALLGFAMATVGAFVAPRAFAQAPSPEQPQEESAAVEASAPLRRVALTFDPVLLAPIGGRSIAQVTSEVRAGRRWGLLVVGGIGARAREDRQTNATTGQLGGGARYYVTGTFDDGLYVTTSVLYAAVTHGAVPYLYSAPPLGLSWVVGFGHKITTEAGFTFDWMLGFRDLVADGHQTVDQDKTRWMLTGNLDVGWTL